MGEEPRGEVDSGRSRISSGLRGGMAGGGGLGGCRASQGRLCLQGRGLAGGGSEGSEDVEGACC